MVVPPSTPVAAPACPAPSSGSLHQPADLAQVGTLVVELERITDPREVSGVRYRLSLLLAVVVCAMTAAGTWPTPARATTRC
ncbi:hypothetical protein [Streptomyces sp. NPDC051576]|uniref:hypothetical protein n=1 Tax=Streptomyces sp. NPDC051576 TaxID=3155803 RepID=UPI003422DDA7